MSAGAGTKTAVPATPAFFGGQSRYAASGATIDVRNPATGEVIGRIPRCTREDVDVAVTAAQEAFLAWRSVPPLERAAMVARLADAVEADRERLAGLDVRDNGSPKRDMANDVTLGAAQLRYFAGLALQLRGETIPSGPDSLHYTLRQPFGVVGRLIPFNHPVMFALGKIAAPLVAGNTVILKPSEHTSLSALALADHLAEIFPPGVVSVVTGLGQEAGDAIVTHPGVHRLAFIGSVETGMQIQARAATVGVKHVTLELGGKNPLVVFPDADVELAVDGAVRGMNFTWQGQSCGSTSRLLVHEDLHDAFVEAVVERLATLRPGPPESEETLVGALVNEVQLEKVMSYVRIGLEQGSRLVLGGKRVTDGGLDRGNFVEPALFTKVEPASRLAQEEIFGPVLAVIRFRTYQEAVEIANGTRFGLTAAVYTSDLARAHAFARDVDAGFVWVNDSSKHFPGVPFGGVKASGVGREEDLSELESYSQVKSVNLRLGSSPA